MPDTSSFESLVADARAANHAIDMGQDETWEISPTSTIDMTGIPSIVGENVTLDFSGAHDWDAGGPILQWEGTTSVAANDISGTKGDHTIQLDTGLSLTNGDTILIASAENLPTGRPYYRKGERKYVRRYDSTNGECEIAEPLQFDYDGSTTTNRVHIPTEQELFIGRGITFVGNKTGKQRLMSLIHCNAEIRSHFKYFRERAIAWVRSRGRFAGSIYGSTSTSGPTTDYGLTVGSLTDLRINAEIWGARHAVTTGSSAFDDEGFAGGNSGTSATWPSRHEINGGVYGTAASKPSRDQRVLDCHGQALSCIIDGAVIYGGVHSAAKYTRISDNEIHFNESMGYYSSSDIDDPARTWGEHEIIDNTFVAEGSVDNPPGYYFKITAVDTTNNIITVARDATVAIQNGDSIDIKDYTTKEDQTKPTVNGAVTYDAASHTTDIPVDSISTDYTGDFVANGRGEYINVNVADGMKSLKVVGNTFRGDYGNSTQKWMDIQKPFGEALIFRDNVIEPENTNQQGTIGAHQDVFATGNHIRNTELEINGQVAGIDIDISDTHVRGSFRRGVVVDGDTGFRPNRVIAEGVKAFNCGHNGFLFRECQQVHVSGAVCQNNGSDTTASNTSRTNITALDCDLIEVENSQLSSTADTVWNLAIFEDDLGSVEYRLAHVDLRGGSAENLHLGVGGTYSLLERKGVIGDTQSDYPDEFPGNAARVHPDGRIDTDTVIQVSGIGGVTPAAGMIQWTGTQFQGYDGSAWSPLGPSSISEDGTLVLGAPTDMNFADGLVVTDDGDNTASVAVADNVARTNISETFNGPLTITQSLTDGQAILTLDAHRAFAWRRRGATASDAALRLESDANNAIEFGDSTGYAMRVIPSSGFVGFGIDVPDAPVDAAGPVKVAGSGGVTDAAGMIRWNGTDFAGYDGTSWVSLTATGGSYTDEQAMDAVAAMLTGGDGITGTYDDPNDTYTVAVDSTVARTDADEVFNANVDVVGIFEARFGGSTNFIVESAGDVGVGTDTPAALFHVQGSGVSARIEDTTGSAVLTMISASNYMALKVNNDGRLSFDHNLNGIVRYIEDTGDFVGDGVVQVGGSGNITDTAGMIRWNGSDFAGYDGTSWVSLTATGSSAHSVSEDGTQVLAEPTDVNFADGVVASDDGDGTVSVAVASNVARTHVNETFEQDVSFQDGAGSTWGRWESSVPGLALNIPGLSPDYILHTSEIGLDGNTDPTDPGASGAVMWVSNGTSTGDPGDLLVKLSDSGGVTKTVTLVDYSDPGAYTDEAAQDAAAAMLTGGDGINGTYDDAGNTYTLAVDSTVARTNADEVFNGNIDVVGIFEARFGGSTNFIVESAGDVGIGTDTPAALLHVQGSGVSARIEDTTGNAVLTMISASNYMALQVNNSGRLSFSHNVNGIVRYIEDTGDFVGDGIVQVGGSGNITDAAGMIRWTGSDFEGYDGTSWQSFTSTGGSYTDEQAQDAAAAMLTGGNAITGTYDDAGNTYTIAVTTNSIGTSELSFDPATQTELNNHAADASAHHSRYTDEEVRDVTAAMLTGGNAITGTYDDGANTYTIAVTSNSIGTSELSFDPATQTELNNHAGNASAHHSRYSDEEARDAIAAMLTGGDGINGTYDDAGNQYTFAVDSTVARTNVNETFNGNVDVVGIFEVRFSGNTLFHVESVGDVGIGTSDPAHNLHVQAAGSSTMIEDTTGTAVMTLKAGNGSYHSLQYTGSKFRWSHSTHGEVRTVEDTGDMLGDGVVQVGGSGNVTDQAGMIKWNGSNLQYYDGTTWQTIATQ